MKTIVSHASEPKHSTSRGLFLKTAIATLGALFTTRALADDATHPALPADSGGPLETSGQVLKSRVRQGQPPVEPLDTMVLFERGDNNNAQIGTHQVISCQHEEKGEKSFPWTIYSHLTTHHVEGDAVVYYSRLHKKNAGWSCGMHSEVYNTARAVGIGVNVEMSNDYKGEEASEIIGINIQAHGPRDCQYGMQIHDAPGGHFETALALNGEGGKGIDLGGKFGVGVNAGNNTIRVNEGTCIELDGEGKIRLRYNKGRIEFLNGEKVVGHLNMEGEDHEM